MSESPLDLEPPSETLAALLRADRATAAVPGDGLAEKQAQVLARLTATLGPLEPPTPPPPDVPPGVPPVSPPPATLVPPADAASGILATMFTRGGLVMLALGTLVGSAASAVFSPRAAPSGSASAVALVSPSSSASFAVAPAPAACAEPPHALAAKVDEPNAVARGAIVPEASASARKAGSSLDTRTEDGRDPELERERALLDVARGALARGNATLALRSLDEHQARFPKGRLVEDREALRIKALVAAGRTNEAERSRAAFATKYPDSFALPRSTDPTGAAGATGTTEREPKKKEKPDTLTDPFSRRQ